MVLRDDRKGKGRDRDLKEQSKVLEYDRKEKGRSRMAYLTDGSDIGHLNLNYNVLTLTGGAAGTNLPYSLVLFVKTAAFLTEDSMGNVTLSYQ